VSALNQLESFLSTHLGGFEINEDVVVIVYRMCVCMRTSTSALEVFAADETAVNVEIQRRHRTDFLEVEVKNSSIYLV